MISLKQGGNLLLLALLCLPSQIHATAGPFDLDLKELERQEPAGPAKSQKKTRDAKKSSVAGAMSGKVRQIPADNSDAARYTVQPGDHIFKILVLHFGLSSEAAERLIPEIIHLNNISNIRRLTIGQTILIPGKVEQEHKATARKANAHNRGEASHTAALPEKPSTLDAKGTAGSSNLVAQVAQMASSPPLEKKPIGLPPAQPLLSGAPVPATALPVPLVIQQDTSVAKPAPLAAPPAAAVTPQITAAPAIPVANTWICSVTEKDTSRIVDAVLNALSVPWSKNRIIQSSAPTTFSIRVDRYFEYKQVRYIVSIGELDPYNYTLVRLLEGAGYRVLRISGGEDFETINRKMFALLGVVPDFRRHMLQGGGRVIISSEPADPHQKWVMAQGCGAR